VALGGDAEKPAMSTAKTPIASRERLDELLERNDEW